LGGAFVFRGLDRTLRSVRDGAGEAWHVHDGALYRVRAHGDRPPFLPERLTWFRWPAYVTWAAGFGLLVLTYLVPASRRLVDPTVAALSPGLAVGLALASLLVGYLLYEALCRSPLACRDVPLLVAVGALLVGMALLNAALFAAPAALLLDGALAGTIMVANIAHVIVPGQRRMVAAIGEGRTPDPAWAARARQRLAHNETLTPAVLLAMLAAHLPGASIGLDGWLVFTLALLVAIGLAASRRRLPWTRRRARYAARPEGADSSGSSSSR
jgi:uncharacterized membrane protein